MKPFYDHAGITIYHGDCREIGIYVLDSRSSQGAERAELAFLAHRPVLALGAERPALIAPLLGQMPLQGPF